MKIFRPSPASCKECGTHPVLTNAGIPGQFQLVCTTCEILSEPDSSATALIILWNLFNIGAVDISLTVVTPGESNGSKQ